MFLYEFRTEEARKRWSDLSYTVPVTKLNYS